MREFIIVTVLCLVAALVADQVWLGGKYFGAARNGLGLEVSSVNRR